MQRTILETTVRHRITKEEKVIFGRYDPVALNNKGYDILSSEKVMYTMTDEKFAYHGNRIEKTEKRGF